MLDFSNTYPDTKFIVLENNYRSIQSILDLSLSLIENNSERLINRLDFLDKKLIAQSPHLTSPEGEEYKNKYFIFQDEKLEKIYVLDEIKKKSSPQPSPEEEGVEKKGPLLQERLGEDSTFAIIVRSNKEV